MDKTFYQEELSKIFNNLNKKYWIEEIDGLEKELYELFHDNKIN